MVGSRSQGESLNLLRTFSIFSRINNYQEALITWEKNPIIGVGYNRIRYSRPASEFSSQTDLKENHAGASYHSSFLIILVSGGVIGLGVFIWLLFEIARLNIFARNGVIFLSLLSLTDNVLLHPFVLCLFLIMILRGFSLFDTSP
jgi:O-antigen ligase